MIECAVSVVICTVWLGAYPPVALFHDARFRIGFAGGPLGGGRPPLGSGLHFLQLLQRLRQSLHLLARRPLAGGRGASIGGFLPRIPHRLHPLLCRFQMRPQGLLAMKRLATGRGFHLRPVVHHLFQRNQPFAAQDRQQLREQLVQRLLMVNAKVRQGVMVDLLAPRQPLISRMVAAAPRRATSRAELTRSLEA